MQVARYDEDTATENIGKDECADFVEVKVKAKTRLFKASGDSGGVPCSLLRQQSASVKSRKRPLRSRLPPGGRHESRPRVGIARVEMASTECGRSAATAATCFCGLFHAN